MDEFLARASLARLALVRAWWLLGRAVSRNATAGQAVKASRALRRAAEALHDAADALEMWAEYARLREGRFGGGRGVL
ncbi:MAG: hypothetical protein ACOY3F_00800 [Bacillota bacterium]